MIDQTIYAVWFLPKTGANYYYFVPPFEWWVNPFPSVSLLFSPFSQAGKGLVWIMSTLQMLGANWEAGASQQEATASLVMLFWETLLGGILFCSGGLLPGSLIEARRPCGAELAAAAQVHWAVLTCSGIPTRCPNSHGKIRRVRQLVQEASAAGWSECSRLCNGQVNQQRGKPVWKQKLALDKLLSLHSHDASLTVHRLGFF